MDHPEWQIFNKSLKISRKAGNFKIAKSYKKMIFNETSYGIDTQT